MGESYNYVLSSGMHVQFDQEFAEFMRPKYEAYLKRALTPPATPEEEMKAELVELVTKEVEKATAERRPEGILVQMPTDNPQRPPARKRQPA